MNWLDRSAERLAYPLRATWVDKGLIIIQSGTAIALIIIGLIALVEWLI